MRNLLVGTIILSACGTALPRERNSSGSPASTSSPSEAAEVMPSADRIAAQLRAEIGERASSEIRMCVTSNGTVKHVVIVRSSSSPSFDRAVVHDSGAWKFTAMQGPFNLVNCGDATIVYGTR